MPESVILAPLDGSPHACSALPVARALAEVLNASVRVIHVGAPSPRPLRQLAEHLGLEHALPPVWSLDARTGEPVSEILDASRATGALLIVMCTHTAPVAPVLGLGRTALGVLRDAAHPLVMVPPYRSLEGWRPRRILVPHDGSPGANAAVAPAAELARRSKGELLIVQVGVAGAAPSREPGSLQVPRYVDQRQHEWPNWAGELLERVCYLCPAGAPPARMFVRGGQPAAEILALAEEQAADLIVLSWKGEWADERAMTLKSVLAHAPCPVMIVPP